MPESSAFHIPHSPVAALGTVALLIAFVVAAYSCGAGIIGNVQQRRKLVTSAIYGLYGFFALMMLASALMIYAFVTHDYTIKYVAHYSDTTMPLYYKITAYWGGLDGSLMFWVAVLSTFSAIAVKVNHHRHRDMIGYVVAVIMGVQLFFLALLIYNKNPFATWLTTPPVDGKGLNPLLQTYWMTIHPPSLYTGFVAATIPFSFGVAALASGRLDDRWLHSVRSWVLICWFFLSFGLILGGRWAYEELGWGGYWAWDPVENAGLLPWFTATAFLHSVIIQEQRGMMKAWNLLLVIITFFLTIFGTFMTRSGVVQSVHAFGEDNALALQFILFMSAVGILSIGLLLYRLPQLRSSNTFESFVSREFAFLLNNWILLSCAAFVLFATMFPTISEAVRGERITVGPPFFNKWMVPLGLTLLLLAGVAPLLAWRRTTVERLWNQFMFPVASMAVTVVVLAVAFPPTRVLTSILSDSVKLPVALVNFGLIAFTLASVGQEFWRGTKVRIRQTGGDAVTSLIGLMLAKRRKYGGYVVHVGIAIMFLGFAGQAFDTMKDFTVSRPATFDAGGKKVKTGETFSVRGYQFEYLGLDTKDDDHKRAVTAHVRLFRDGETLARLHPARWQYKKLPDQPTTEVDMYHRMKEDVYMVLSGFDPETKVANFRIYINPLINWVWLGFAFLALGAAICLLPQRWVDNLKPKRPSARSRLGSLAILLLLGTGITFAMVQAARAQAPEIPGAEYQEAPVHNIGGGVSRLYHPDDPAFLGPYRQRAVAEVKHQLPGLPEGSGEFEAEVQKRLAPIAGVADKLMHEVICTCGGCQRESVRECRCGVAAEATDKPSRKMILTLLGNYDLWTKGGRQKAHDEILAKLSNDYGQRVLMVPRDEGFNRLSWIVPYVALGGALVLLYGFGRRWVQKGKAEVAEQNAIATTDGLAEDEEYADLLDDELLDTD